ncbi:MAG: phosphoenolpyruvate synthase [Methanomicrobiales archaeon]|jgi:pyruvate,water dikinase|nr:phosphoenolpyruvate synthase [Methanomicrobiales archaeon]
MTKVPDILWLEEIRKEDIASVGGKGASLGEMASIGLPVPPAFVVTSQAFRQFLIESGLENSIFDEIDALNVEDSAALREVSEKTKKKVMAAAMPQSIRDEVTIAYKRFSDAGICVAVRSSATAEDLPDASFAGQQETFLNVSGLENVLHAIQECWSSLYNGRAIYYRAKQGFDNRSINIAVVVQQLVPSEKAGVMFTSHPVTGEALTIIEGSWGLGEAVVSGSVSPDNYVWNKASETVVGKRIAKKLIEIVNDGVNGTKTLDVSPERQEEEVLSDDAVSRLATYGYVAEEHYGIPQDMEWSIVGDEFFVLQSRPITTINMPKKDANSNVEIKDEVVIVQGIGASPGLVSGPVIRVKDVTEIDRVKVGDIMVTTMTNPDMVPAMRKTAGIVTDEGGLTCHAAIVSRELGTPAIVGTRNATQILQEGQIITIDGEKGLVYDGLIERALQDDTDGAQTVLAKADIITATSVKVNVSMAEAAKRAAATGADAVGLLRIEHLLIGLGRTPGWFIDNHKEEEFIDELFSGIKTVLDAFPGKSVWVRTLDMPTDEFRNMQGGHTEPLEHNPMLGWRGIRRDLETPDQFGLQIETFKKLWALGYNNLGIMFPMVSHPNQFIRAKQLFAEAGVDVNAVELGIMVEIPACALMIQEFIDAGISFASFGTNDLIQYTIAVDRNNEHVTHMYWPKHPAVLKLIKDTIAVCRANNVEVSICGQAGSDPNMVKWLVEMGIDSVSANIDAVEKIRHAVAKTEQRIILDNARRIL